MAITTTLTLKSDAGDLLTDELSVVTSKDLHKAGTTTDLNQVRMGRNDVPTGTDFDLLDATTLAINKANKVYISNRSTDETYYIILIIDAKVIGRLYGGDWMFIPWNCDDETHDLEVTAYTGTNTIEWACFHEGETLPTQGD